MSAPTRQAKANLCRWGTAVALVLALGAVGACDSLLDVNLPDAVTEEALNDPSTASLQVNSVMGQVECIIGGGLALHAAGNEDNFQEVTGVSSDFSLYELNPGGGCGGNVYTSGWLNQVITARRLGYDYYDNISDWTVQQVPDKNRFQGTVALYTGINLGIAGEYLCEFAIDAGPLMTYSQTLDLAEDWIDTAIGHINSEGDYEINTSAGLVTPSALTLAYGIRARVRWANGDLAGAASDAAQVPDGFYAFVTRENGDERRNTVASAQGGGGGVQAAGFLQGPVKLKTDENQYGVSALGNNPVTGEPWPNPVPFTGYLNLAVTADGRAVDDDGYPITTATAGAVGDPRVQHVIGNTAGGPDNIVTKYDDQDDDVPLLSWVEMRLIRAEAAGGQAAIDHVNAVRSGSYYYGGGMIDVDLPEVTYVDPGNADQIENMIFEERRRGLWLEARFWSTKILNTDKLWFPRQVGEWVNAGAVYQLEGTVRQLMPNDEYVLNENLGLDARGTGCPAVQAPVFN